MAQMWRSDAWSRYYDHAGERSDDTLDRYDDPARIAARNGRKVRGMLAECGECGRLLDTGRSRDVAHANKCADAARPVQYGSLR